MVQPVKFRQFSASKLGETDIYLGAIRASLLKAGSNFLSLVLSRISNDKSCFEHYILRFPFLFEFYKQVHPDPPHLLFGLGDGCEGRVDNPGQGDIIEANNRKVGWDSPSVFLG